MVILLTDPFSLGDLSPDTFPHVYVTNFAINGPAATATVSVEVGRMATTGQWQPAPINTSQQINVSGQDLAPFFYATPTAEGGPLWDQVERVVYAHVQKTVPRYAGEVVDPTAVSVSAPVATPEPETAESSNAQ